MDYPVTFSASGGSIVDAENYADALQIAIERFREQLTGIDIRADIMNPDLDSVTCLGGSEIEPGKWSIGVHAYLARPTPQGEER